MTSFDKRVLMNVNEMKAVIHMPEAVKVDKDKEGNEKDNSLPPYAPRFLFSVDEYPASPTNWMHGSGKAGSYFMPVVKDKGMWLDFNYAYSHPHDVAVVISVQGINPITGQKTKELRLEQYKEKCPVHDKEFKSGRFCEECGYKWEAQNYLSTTGTPQGLLWLDGFRAVDGAVRQYIFTEEVTKGVAAQVIGDDRVYAIGIAFYLSKEPKKKATYGSGGKLWGFPPSNTISPSVHIGPQDLSHSTSASQSSNSSTCTNFDGGEIATFKRISIPLEKRTPPINSYAHEDSGLECCKTSDPTELASLGFSNSNPPPLLSTINCSMPGSVTPKGGTCNDQAGAGITQPDAIPDSSYWATPEKHQIKLHDTNDFVDMSTAVNRNSRCYPSKAAIIDAAKLKILADNPQLLGVPANTCLDPESHNPRPKKRKHVMDPESFCPRQDEDYWAPTKGGFPNDDAISLQQMADGSGNLDIYYSTQMINGVEVDLDTGLPVQEYRDMVEIQADIEKEMTHLEIGAGARIKQQVYRDWNNLDFWQDEPVAMMYVNYVSLEDAEKILDAGKRDMTKKGEGFMSEMELAAAI